MALVGSLLLVAPALAAAPDNDEFTGVPILVAVGDVITQDTLEAATTDPFETSLNEFCGAPKVEHGVWFTFVAAANGFVAFDTSASDYAAGMMVFDGEPTPNSLWTCGPDRVAIEAFEGTTYNILAFGDGLSEATGGSLIFAVEDAVPPPIIDVTVSKFGTVDKSDQVRISGTVRCESTDGSGTIFDLYGEMRQRVGRLNILGFFYTELGFACDGESHAWEAYAIGENGVFRGGKSATVSFAFGCTDLCNEGYAEAVVQLKRGR
jgi:hypothetical protein